MKVAFNDIFALGEIQKVLTEEGFAIVHHERKSGKSAHYVKWNDIDMSDAAKRFWEESGYDTMWAHQKKAIEMALSGNNVCVSTSTSSGKTEIFQTIAIDVVNKRPKKSKVLAVYSAKALNRQQWDRWRNTKLIVGQIDGDTKDFASRINKLKTCDVIVITPDVLHAFILGNIRHRQYGDIIQNFIRSIELIIVDEIHLYRGIFGTNAAYLFRRLNNVRRLLRKDLSFPLYITASATLPNPDEHSELITGALSFVNIGVEEDGSPSAPIDFYYIEVNSEQENAPLVGSDITRLIVALAKYKNARSITFVSGRQQTGNIVLDAEMESTLDSNGIRQDNIQLSEDKDVITFFKNNLEQFKIYPFRAGIEAEARTRILKAMATNNFNGIVSTSALEIGINVSGLNIAFIANMPYDMNSYMQRIGRVGRGSIDNHSIVIIANDGSINAKRLFSDKSYDITRILPDLEPALHLANENIMFAHAACHIDLGKNCELTLSQSLDANMNKYFTPQFVALCKNIISGNRSKSYDRIMGDVDCPHKQFSLRCIGRNYQIYLDGEEAKGDNVTRIQQFREAYLRATRIVHKAQNGAIKNIKTRITGINQIEKIISSTIEYDKYRLTQPYMRTFVTPNFKSNQRYKTLRSDGITIYSLRVYERRVAYGFYEIHGTNKIYKPYDNQFISQIATTGVVIFHPSFNNDEVNVDQVARMVYESFLLQKAFDRSDINFESGRMLFPNEYENINVNDRFVVIYDLNQLDITHQLLEPKILHDTFMLLNNKLHDFGSSFFEDPISEATIHSVDEVCKEILSGKLQDIDTSTDSISRRIIRTMSKAQFQYNSWCGINEQKSLDCIIMGYNIKEDGSITYNIVVQDPFLTIANVNEEFIIPTTDTEFETIELPDEY